ncbi:MAG TPA: 2-amino-4-hydroxy-6-hydroxymethyldihydropteridine diphosphokinase [Bryobacteraceae bacterium]|jgi:2-amino-4-hydroxy-6-hydroxymethyldihydropteridine diphosphokinase|nr:2-amino-4-hydroxy-6-hydroxymethyldihydropteridine diphosphokinase [Bryobacteraceae bacterium]
MPLRQVYLSLGSNLGDRRQNLANALDALEAEGVHVRSCSSVYETEPQDVTDQPWFLNMAVQCETSVPAPQLLALTQEVERRLGRVREGKPPRGPRLIDIDILLFGDAQIATGELVIPHPRMRERRFVLDPLLEIAPDLRDPSTNEPLRQYLARVREQKVKRLDPLGRAPAELP